MRRFAIALAAAAAALLPLAGTRPAEAQDAAYPTRPVRLIVPFGAGGTTDVFGRLIGDRLSARMGQQFIVENIAGAGGNTGAAAIARAAPDGYTIGMGTVSSHAINPSLYKARMPYDALKDFAPLTLVATQPNVLVVHPSVPAKTVPELIAYLKANPGRNNFASSGVGTSIHLAGELFKQLAGVDIAHVPYRSSAAVMNDMVAGQVKMSFDNVATAMQQVQAGNLRALAVTSAQRTPVAPELPAVAEFLPGFEATSWHGFFAPAGVPKPILDKLAAELRAVIADPTVSQRIRELGATPSGMSPEEFAAFIRADTARWAPVVEQAGIKIE